MVSNLEINEIKKEGPINIFSPCVYKGTFCLKEERLTRKGLRFWISQNVPFEFRDINTPTIESISKDLTQEYFK